MWSKIENHRAGYIFLSNAKMNCFLTFHYKYKQWSGTIAEKDFKKLGIIIAKYSKLFFGYKDIGKGGFHFHFAVCLKSWKKSFKKIEKESVSFHCHRKIREIYKLGLIKYYSKQTATEYTSNEEGIAEALKNVSLEEMAYNRFCFYNTKFFNMYLVHGHLNKQYLKIIGNIKCKIKYGIRVSLDIGQEASWVYNVLLSRLKGKVYYIMAENFMETYFDNCPILSKFYIEHFLGTKVKLFKIKNPKWDIYNRYLNIVGQMGGGTVFLYEMTNPKKELHTFLKAHFKARYGLGYWRKRAKKYFFKLEGNLKELREDLELAKINAIVKNVNDCIIGTSDKNIREVAEPIELSRKKVAEKLFINNLKV